MTTTGGRLPHPDDGRHGGDGPGGPPAPSAPPTGSPGRGEPDDGRPGPGMPGPWQPDPGRAGPWQAVPGQPNPDRAGWRQPGQAESGPGQPPQGQAGPWHPDQGQPGPWQPAQRQPGPWRAVPGGQDRAGPPAAPGPPPPWPQTGAPYRTAYGSGWPPPPPPGRGRRTLITLIAVGTLVLAGLGVGGFLLVSSLRGQSAAELTPVRTQALTYGVPVDWTQGGRPLADVLGVETTGVARGAAYDCRGDAYLRGVVASALVPLAGPPDEVASAAARALASDYYTGSDGTRPDVTLEPPRPVDVGGVAGALVEATSRTAQDDGCLATAGTVLVLAVPSGGGTAVLVVNGDTAGGPQDAPPVPSRATLEAIVASARPAGI